MVAMILRSGTEVDAWALVVGAENFAQPRPDAVDGPPAPLSRRGRYRWDSKMLLTE